jgi:hypothetical protein
MIKSRTMREAERVARMGRRQMHRGHWWESKKERPRRRPGSRYVDNIRMDLGDKKGGMDCIDLLRIGSCEHGNELGDT